MIAEVQPLRSGGPLELHLLILALEIEGDGLAAGLGPHAGRGAEVRQALKPQHDLVAEDVEPRALDDGGVGQAGERVIWQGAVGGLAVL